MGRMGSYVAEQELGSLLQNGPYCDSEKPGSLHEVEHSAAQMEERLMPVGEDIAGN